jgi:hypothetical protein
MTYRHVRPGALVVACALLISGGADGRAGSTTTRGRSATTTSTAVSTSTTVDPADFAVAASAALTVGDLPGGWIQSAARETARIWGPDGLALEKTCPDLIGDLRAIHEEAGTPPDILRAFSREISGNHGSGSVESVSESTMFPSEGVAKRAFEALADRALVTCLALEMTASPDSTVTKVDGPTVEAIPFDAGSLDDAGGLESVVTITSKTPPPSGLPSDLPDTTIRLRSAAVVLRSGRMVHSVILMTLPSDPGAPIPELHDVIDAAVARTEAACADGCK